MCGCNKGRLPGAAGAGVRRAASVPTPKPIARVIRSSSLPKRKTV